MNPIGDDPYAAFLGLRWDDAGTIRVTIRPELLNSAGRLLGPVGFSLVDYAMASALYETLGEGESMATTGISINYVASAVDGDVECVARVDHRGRRAAFLSASVTHSQSERLLATAIGTFAVFGPARPATGGH